MNQKSTTTIIHELELITSRALSKRARFGHVSLLLAATGMNIVIASLLATERGLPLRTSATFVVLLAIGICWIAYAVWVLRNRQTLLANHRIVAGRMAVTFSAVFACGAFGFGLATGKAAMFLAAALGAVMLVVAVTLLLRAHRHLSELVARRTLLERELKRGSA